MAIGLFSFLAMLAVSLLLDSAVRPCRSGIRQWRGRLIHSLTMAVPFGLVLAITGNSWVAALFATAIAALLVIVSNAKHAMLGEPLLFSDLVLLVWVFRHPRFYLTALSPGQRWGLALGTPILLLIPVLLFVPQWAPHLMGLAVLTVAVAALLAALALLRESDLARVPDVDVDLMRFGLIPTLLLYTLRWCATPDPEACPPGIAAASDQPELIVIVQCESFADPLAITGADLALPGLARARKHAWQWGELHVSGFGAYTMRTEYGVLFGRGEDVLGFRRFDPFLSALGETSYALPARLREAGYRSLFVHPHDMRFYGRDRLMPAIGFHALVGEDSFPPVPQDESYVPDRMLGAKLEALIDEADGPTLIYAVTMENHGPWIRDPDTGSHGGIAAYLHHLANSDAMLSGLIDRLSSARRSALLVFFGDHRPSIPGVTHPGGDRHTPYVILRFTADGEPVRGVSGPISLTPAALHHAILDRIRESAAQG